MLTDERTHMKERTTTLNTKRMLAASLKRFMQEKPLSKITVSEIIADCGVNRKTFYYHFDNIYSLLKWMLEDEAINKLSDAELTTYYRDVVIYAMNYIQQNKQLLCSAYDSVSREELKRLFYDDFSSIVTKIIQNHAQELGVTVDAQLEEFLVHFYTEAIAGLLIDELKMHDAHDPESAVKYLTLVLNDSITAILKAQAR
jgi:probable dihydroxyacetone kinase regulator